ncbi:MFS transporter [Nitratireductor rhodophyticola]|uniref:MFS transporter n=1 Tax=Nitratireductor rhodophyticola TaxID=2854036 RepID=UPI0032D8CC23
MMALLSSLDGSKLELDFGSAKWSQYRTNLSRLSLFLFAVTCGVSVANIYYAQPSLDAIAASFAIEPGRIGIVVTLTHVGYVLGLLFLVPLGDILDRRKLIIGQTLLSTGALAIVGTAPTATIFLIGMIAVGLLGVVVQSLVALTATLASPHERGQSVGFVTAGVITGILGARFISGALADMGGWRLVYLVSAGLMLCLSLLLMRVLPRHIQRARSENYLAILRSMPGLFLRDPLLRSRAILAFLVFASFSTLWTAMVLPLSAQSLSHTQIGLFGFAGLAGALAASGAGRLADRGLGNWTTVAALVLLTVSWLPISLLSSSLVLLGLGVVLLDLAVQAVHVTNQSLIFAAHAGSHSRLVGGYMTFYSLGSAVGAIASTTVYEALSWAGVSMLGTGFSLTALVILAFLGTSRVSSPDA